jgi:hypothetical protein
MKNKNNSSLHSILIYLSTLIVYIAAVSSAAADYLKMNPPPDVDKIDHNDWNGINYKPTCWVATAANMLAGAGYGDGNTVQKRADEIYDEICDGNIVDCCQTGWTDTALKAWLDSNDNKWKQTNPYKKITVYGEPNCKSTRAPWRNPDLPKFLGNHLRSTAMAVLSINATPCETQGHAVTAWGDGNDADELTGNPGKVKVSDSDYFSNWNQVVQTYTYDDYNNYCKIDPCCSNGVGWYFNYNYTPPPHYRIDNVTLLTPEPCASDPNIGSTRQCVGSYKIKQNNSSGSATGLRYKVSSDKMFWYQTSIDWDTNNPPTITEINNPPTQLQVSWDLNDNPVPYGTDVNITTRVEIPCSSVTGVSYSDVNFSYPQPGSLPFPYLYEIMWHHHREPPGLIPNATGGHVVGAFGIYIDPDGMNKIAEYRFTTQYDYTEDPEYHEFFLDSASPQPYYVGNFRFGHSYASLEDKDLWKFDNWWFVYPVIEPIGTPIEIGVDFSGRGLLPYPKGQDDKDYVPPQKCGDPGTRYASGDIDKDCKVDWRDFARFALPSAACTPFSDNFDDGNISDWTVTVSGDATFGVSTGKFVSPPYSVHMSSTGNYMAMGVSPVYELDLTKDYNVSFDFLLPHTNNHWFEVFNNHQTYLVIDYSTDLKWYVEPGPAQLIMNLQTNRWYRIELKVHQLTSTYDVYIDGEPKATCPFWTHAGFENTFRIGDRADDSTDRGEAYWDNIVIEQVKYSDGDINKDCKVDLQDLALFAETWLMCTDPNQANCP